MHKLAALARFDHPVIPFVGRLLITYIYATSGYAKVFGWSGNVQYMNRHHLRMIPLLLAAAAVVEIVGSFCLITGYQARAAAFIMFGYTLIMTILLHNYWAYSGDAAGMQETEFRKNLAIMGGLLMLGYAGPGGWSWRGRVETASYTNGRDAVSGEPIQTTN
jgi:putative oxidoreductase